MEIYLIRHTTPDIEKGRCYGQTDLDTTDTFEDEAACIQKHLPDTIARVYSSPLKRCHQLAQHLFQQHHIHLDDRLKEIHCGEWEMQWWDAIDRASLQRWMDNRLEERIPGGESYQLLYERVVHFFESLQTHNGPIAIVTHGGVIRSLLSYINAIALKDSFGTFPISYGCLVHIKKAERLFSHRFLHNPPTPEEQHRPSFY